MKKTIGALGILLSINIFAVPNIGITQIIEHPSLDAVRSGFEKAIKDSNYRDTKIEYQNAQGEFATAQLISNKFVSDKKDVIVAISTPSAQAAYNSTKEIPILFSAVTDPASAGFPTGKNITGTSDLAPIEKQLSIAKEILPKIKKVGMIYTTSEKNSEYLVELTKEIGKKLDLEIVSVGVTNLSELLSATDSILKKSDVIYITTDNLVSASIPMIIQKANKKNIPIIGSTKDHVLQGALITETIDYEKLGYQTGIMATKILNGENVETLPVETMKETDLIVNKAAAEKYKVDLSNLKNAQII